MAQLPAFTRRIAFALAAVLLPASAAAPGEVLRSAVEGRFLGDRTGVCIAAALVGESTATAFVSADEARPRKVDEHTAFEIGSVSSTLASALLAELIQRGGASLDDPLAKFLPKGTKVPDFKGAPITLGHLATHRSGLPSLPGRMRPADMANPYASLTQEELLASLGDVSLEAAPGTQVRYSNFGMMLLSLALARQGGQDFPTLLSQRILKPLGMDDARTGRSGSRDALGHASTGRAAGAWDFPPDLAGAGGVRASLSDMVRYVEGELGRRPSSAAPALLATQGPAPLGWMTQKLAGRTILFSEGGTGGFSCYVALDPERHQGVVLMADTALVNLGGLGALALSILDPAAPAPGFPRRTVPPGALLLDGMPGLFSLQGGPQMIIEKQDGKLFAQAVGQPLLELAYDSAGEFYALDQDAVIRPVRTGDGYTFVLRQGGGQMKATRLPGMPGKAEPPGPGALKAYVGAYDVAPGFTVKVTLKGSQLMVQGTGQPETPVDAVREDVFVNLAAGVVFTFTRDASGKVEALAVRQNGRTLKGGRI